MSFNKNAGTFLSDIQIQILEDLANASFSPQAIIIRANIILLCAQGKLALDIEQELGISYPPINKWRGRWLQSKAMLDQIEKDKTKGELKKAIEHVLKDAPRSGAPADFTEIQILQIIALACTSPQEEGLPVSHWSCRSLAKHVIKKGIVKNISHSRINVFLKSRADKTTQGKMLVKFQKQKFRNLRC